MTTDDNHESLADAAAAWVPPWDRPKPENPDQEPEASHDTGGGAEPTAVPIGPPAEAAPTEPASQRSTGLAGQGPTEPAGDAHAAVAESPATLVEESAALVEESAALAEESAEPALAEKSAALVEESAAHAEESAEPALAGEEPAPPPVPVTPLETPSAPPVPSQKGRKEPAAAGGTAPTAEAAPKRRRAKAAAKAEPDPDPVSLIDDAELRGALEAILLVVDEPVAEVMLSQVLEQPTERVTQMLYLLSGEYTDRGHGFDLRRVAGGWRLYTRPEYAAYVERFVLDGQTARLTQAALETLAVVAYKQPCSRSQVSAIRGVNCDGVMRTLVARGLVEECGADTSGAYLYKTTTLFLEKLGLDSVAQLPPLAPFLPDNVEEIVIDA